MGGLTLLRVTKGARLLVGLFQIKGRLLRALPTQYSFPSATEAQFPALDKERLARYTRELEALGFVALIDFSLTPDRPAVSNFFRLFVNRRLHCFASVRQFFLPGPTVRVMGVAITSLLQDNWAIVSNDGDPRGAIGLSRTPRTLRIYRVGAATGDLLTGHLAMRAQVCTELGLGVLTEDTQEAYFAYVGRNAAAVRTAVEARSTLTHLTQIAGRRLARLRRAHDDVWLGDYPKETEKRKFTNPVVPQ